MLLSLLARLELAAVASVDVTKRTGGVR